MKPIVHGLEAEYWGEIDFVYLDRDDAENKEVMSRYNFRVQPHFVFVDSEGEVLQEWFGALDGDQFRTTFDAYLADPGG